MGERKKFDKAFKEQVTRRIIDRDTAITNMAEELGVHYTKMRDWVRQYERDA
jgi:transposase